MAPSVAPDQHHRVRMGVKIQGAPGVLNERYGARVHMLKSFGFNLFSLPRKNCAHG
jgi:hypothetical protein